MWRATFRVQLRPVVVMAMQRRLCSRATTDPLARPVASNLAAYGSRRWQSPMERHGLLQRCYLGRPVVGRGGQTPVERPELHDAQGVGGSNPLSPTTVDLRKRPQVNCFFGE